MKLAQKFLGDHFDSYEKKEDADERTLCGHVENSPRGVQVWDASALLTRRCRARQSHRQLAGSFHELLRASWPSLRDDFIADDFLNKHPDFDWQKPVLTDMKAGPWTFFKPADKQ